MTGTIRHCGYCRTPGHNVRTCARKAAGSRVQTCGYCHKGGHNARTCPSVPSADPRRLAVTIDVLVSEKEELKAALLEEKDRTCLLEEKVRMLEDEIEHLENWSGVRLARR